MRQGPRDTHKFVLEAAIDPEALQYVGAIAFPLLGRRDAGAVQRRGGTSHEWLRAAAAGDRTGVDAAAYNTRS